MKIDRDLLTKYNKPGPRYTSYPPANYFHTEFTVDDYKQSLVQSNKDNPDYISLYVHIPFCPKLCHFCGCNTTGMRNKDLVRSYVDALKTEIENVSQHLDLNRPVTQVHWGGGTPNSIPLDYVAEVMDLLNNKFKFSSKPEIAMECSPAYLSLEDIDRLAEIGFNRLSLGIQDFNDEVLHLVNRDPSKLPVEDLVKRMKEKGFEGVNLDLIYGLPGQTVESFKQNIRKAIEINPDRLVTFSYAHVPWVKSAQKVLEKYHIPEAEEKMSMMEAGYDQLKANGYVPIGMDHYAKPEDELFKALENKTLHRNFQGYCTRETTGQVYGFGSSSISQLTGAYMQNTKLIQGYIDQVKDTGYAVERGYSVTREQQITRTVINDIMCNMEVDFESIASGFNTNVEEVKKVIGYDQNKLLDFLTDSLIEINGNKIIVKQEGAFFIRNIAMALDPMLSVSENQYSKTI